MLGDDNRWRLSRETIVEGADAQRYCPRERVGDLPAFCMDWFDAVAYCAWRGARDGQVYRLPAEVEHEKAARGADGRRFPKALGRR